MSVKMELDASEFIETMRVYQKLRKKDDEEIVIDRAGKLAYEFFKQFKATAPKISELRALPARLNHRIKRKFAGSTVKQEINRRINARFAAAGGWIAAIKRFSKKNPADRKGKVIGGFRINLSEPSVIIFNGMKEAVAAEAKHKVMQSAIDAQTADMLKYIDRKLTERAKQFSK